MGADRKLPLEIDALSFLSEALNFDFASKGHGRAVHGRGDGKKSPACRPFGIGWCARAERKTRRCANSFEVSGRGRVHDPIVGGSKEICRSFRAVVGRAAHATGLWLLQRTFPALTRILCRSWCRSSSGVGCCARIMAGAHCARICTCRFQSRALGGSGATR